MNDLIKILDELDEIKEVGFELPENLVDMSNDTIKALSNLWQVNDKYPIEILVEHQQEIMELFIQEDRESLWISPKEFMCSAIETILDKYDYDKDEVIN